MLHVQLYIKHTFCRRRGVARTHERAAWITRLSFTPPAASLRWACWHSPTTILHRSCSHPELVLPKQTPQDQRPASEVFKSSAAVKESQLKSRFSSTGQFTAAQLEAGDDDQGTEAVPEPEFDPEDKRCLYDRLQAQKDAKQEEWDKEHQFKNQVRTRRPARGPH
jgi:hypothetical protein